MHKGILLAPSMFGMALSMSAALQTAGSAHRLGGTPLSASEMKATRGAGDGGTCSIAVGERPDGPLCNPIDGGGSYHDYFNPGLTCSGGPGSCVINDPQSWCEVDKVYYDNNCTVLNFSTTQYQDKCT